MYNLKPHGAQMLINVCICCFCKHMTFPVPVVSALMRLIQYSMCGQCTCIFLLQTNSTETHSTLTPGSLGIHTISLSQHQVEIQRHKLMLLVQ